MPHSIILTRQKIDCLQGANVTGAGQLETLWTNIQAADEFLQSSSEEEPEIHEWLEQVEESLVSACAAFSDLNGNCPSFT